MEDKAYFRGASVACVGGQELLAASSGLSPSSLCLCLTASSCASSARQTRGAVAGSQHQFPQVEGAALLQRGDHCNPGTGSPRTAGNLLTSAGTSLPASLCSGLGTMGRGKPRVP